MIQLERQSKYKCFNIRKLITLFQDDVTNLFKKYVSAMGRGVPHRHDNKIPDSLQVLQLRFKNH